MKQKPAPLDVRIVITDDELAAAIRESAEREGRNIQQEVRYRLRQSYLTDINL